MKSYDVLCFSLNWDPIPVDQYQNISRYIGESNRKSGRNIEYKWLLKVLQILRWVEMWLLWIQNVLFYDPRLLLMSS